MFSRWGKHPPSGSGPNRTIIGARMSAATGLHARKIFCRCFSRDEFQFLQLRPEFMEATRQLETIEDTLNAIELGEELIRQGWKRVICPFPTEIARRGCDDV